MMRLLGIFFLLICAINSYADIYEQENSNGISYSDTQDAQSTPVAPSDTSSTISTQPTQNSNEAMGFEINATKKIYTAFYIESPKNQETIQNQPIIPVILKVIPELQAGDKIQLMLDNKLVGNAVTKTQLALEQVDRGSHSLYALLLDANNRTLKQSEVITIFVHKTSILLPHGQ